MNIKLFRKIFWFAQMVFAAYVFYYHQKHTVTWGGSVPMPEAFTSKQIVAEIWSAAAILWTLIAASSMEHSD